MFKIKSVVYFCFQVPQLHKLVEYLSQCLPTVDLLCEEKGFVSSELSLKCAFKVP